LSDAAPRLFNANTLIWVEGTDRFINRREHLRCFFHFQRRIDLDQAAEDGLPFARVEPGQFLEDFPYAHRSRLRHPASGGNDRFIHRLCGFSREPRRWTERTLAECGTLEKFTDVHEIQNGLKAKGLAAPVAASLCRGVARDLESTTGPASLMLIDPDGNSILIDQHVDSPPTSLPSKASH
jgi:hypothetical protein